MTILDDLSAEPELKQVCARMGFKPNRADIPNSMKPLVEEAIHLGRELLEPRTCFDFHPIGNIEPDRIEINPNFSIQSEKVFRWMDGCNGLYLAAVTIGPELDQKVAQLSSSGEVTRAFLLNAYGAEAAEALMNTLNKRITGLAEERNLATTKRYSPGYGDWSITAQKELLETLQAHRIGIHLTETYLMIPEKSISAIIGTRSAENREER